MKKNYSLIAILGAIIVIIACSHGCTPFTINIAAPGQRESTALIRDQQKSSAITRDQLIPILQAREQQIGKSLEEILTQAFGDIDERLKRVEGKPVDDMLMNTLQNTAPPEKAKPSRRSPKKK